MTVLSQHIWNYFFPVVSPSIHQSAKRLLYFALCWRRYYCISTGHLLLATNTWIVHWRKPNVWHCTIFFFKYPLFTKSRTPLTNYPHLCESKNTFQRTLFSNLICSIYKHIKIYGEKCWWDLMTPYLFHFTDTVLKGVKTISKFRTLRQLSAE